jgi:hypothetical protein
MRKRLLVLLMAIGMLVMSAAPAMATHSATDRPHPARPVAPPGLDRGPDAGPGSPAHKEEARPEQASTPLTGGLNRFFHGSPQNGK